jgi:hypothetical protein
VSGTWQELLRRAVIAALVALAVSMTARATGSPVSAGVPAAIVGALFVAGLVRSALRGAPAMAPTLPLVSVRRRPVGPDRNPTALARIEQLLVLSGDPQFGRSERMRRELLELVADHLANAGVVADDPVAVRGALGEEAADALAGDAPLPAGRIEIVIDAIEALRADTAPRRDLPEDAT